MVPFTRSPPPPRQVPRLERTTDRAISDIVVTTSATTLAGCLSPSLTAVAARLVDPDPQSWALSECVGQRQRPAALVGGRRAKDDAEGRVSVDETLLARERPACRPGAVEIGDVDPHRTLPDAGEIATRPVVDQPAQVERGGRDVRGREVVGFVRGIGRDLGAEAADARRRHRQVDLPDTTRPLLCRGEDQRNLAHGGTNVVDVLA